MMELFYELFSGLPRQGPGDAESTRRALALVPGVGPKTRVVDIGCGTGMQTLTLAERSGARIVAVDTHPPFIEELKRRAAARGLDRYIDARVADMRALGFPSGSFDLIWCEGAIFIVGFEAGLRLWKPLLAPGGHLAVTEACWTTPDPPAECVSFWNEEYPAIRDREALLALVPECGYETVGHFTVPPASWWDDYYRPLQENVVKFRARHPADADAQALADQIQREIDIWRKYSAFYSYEFIVARAR